ncbi:MAG: GAF domain-containing protein, partial [Chloroflexota bacterium]|nr:GAF domain-containing protein [Chloroflexota bacterium]
MWGRDERYEHGTLHGWQAVTDGNGNDMTLTGERLLHRLSTALAREARPDAVVRVALDALVSEVGARSAGVFLFNEATASVSPVYTVNYLPDMLEQIRNLSIDSPALSNLAIRTGEVQVISSVNDVPDGVVFTKQLADMIGVQAVAAVPLLMGGRRLGVLVYGLAEEHQFDEAELRLLQEVGERISTAMERARLEQELARRADEAELLHSIALAAAGEDDINLILEATLAQLAGLLNFTGGSIAVVEGDDLVIRAATGVFATTALNQRLSRGRGMSWRVLMTGTPFLSHDLLADGLRPLSQDDEKTVRSILVVPLIWRGMPFGVLEVDSIEPNAFHASDIDLMQRVATFLSGPIELARRYAAEVQLRRDLDQALAAAEQAIASRDRFISIASHELKTPLTSIKGMAQLLLRAHASGRLDIDRIGRQVGTIDTQAARLQDLIDDLLDISRIQSGRLELRREPSDVVQIVGDLIGSLPDERRQRVSLDADGSVPGNWDPMRLEQVAQNLLDNALKYAPPETTVEIRVRTDGSEAILTVTDHGIGIPANDLPTLFEPFSRAANAGQRDATGLGLGLYITRQIVEA